MPPSHHLFGLRPDLSPALYSLVFPSAGQSLTSKLSLPSASRSMMSKMSSWIFSPCRERHRREGQDEGSREYLFSAPRTLPWDTAATLKQSLSCDPQPNKTILQMICSLHKPHPGCPSCQVIPLSLIYCLVWSNPQAA